VKSNHDCKDVICDDILLPKMTDIIELRMKILSCVRGIILFTERLKDRVYDISPRETPRVNSAIIV